MNQSSYLSAKQVISSGPASRRLMKSRLRPKPLKPKSEKLMSSSKDWLPKNNNLKRLRLKVKRHLLLSATKSRFLRWETNWPVKSLNLKANYKKSPKIISKCVCLLLSRNTTRSTWSWLDPTLLGEPPSQTTWLRSINAVSFVWTCSLITGWSVAVNLLMKLPRFKTKNSRSLPLPKLLSKPKRRPRNPRRASLSLPSMKQSSNFFPENYWLSLSRPVSARRTATLAQSLITWRLKRGPMRSSQFPSFQMLFQSRTCLFSCLTSIKKSALLATKSLKWKYAPIWGTQ